MANELYDHGREGFLDGSIDWDTDDIRAILIDEAEYTPDLAADENLEDIPGAARVAVSGALTGKDVSAGVADADDVTFSAVSGDECESIVLYKHTGNEATARLIAYIDTAGATLPVTPNGGDIEILWSDGGSKIFKL